LQRLAATRPVPSQGWDRPAPPLRADGLSIVRHSTSDEGAGGQCLLVGVAARTARGRSSGA
jgi:hypothetical protein